MRTYSVSTTAILRTVICLTCLALSTIISPIGTAAVFTPSVSETNHYTPGIGVPPPNNQPGFEIRTWLQPNTDDIWNEAELWLTVDSNLVLSPYSQILDPGANWYNVSYGTPLNSAFCSTTTPFAGLIGTYSTNRIPLSVGQDFYLGFWIRDYGTNLYGWAHLELTSPSTLALLGSATENSGAGIIAGTTTAIPEPSSLCLIAAALALLLPALRMNCRRG